MDWSKPAFVQLNLPIAASRSTRSLAHQPQQEAECSPQTPFQGTSPSLGPSSALSLPALGVSCNRRVWDQSKSEGHASRGSRGSDQAEVRMGCGGKVDDGHGDNDGHAAAADDDDDDEMMMMLMMMTTR